MAKKPSPPDQPVSLNAVLAELEKFKAPLITDAGHPATWWNLTFGKRLRLEIEQAQKRLTNRIRRLEAWQSSSQEKAIKPPHSGS